MENSSDNSDSLISLDTRKPIWEQFFSVFPLVLIGTREENGEYDLAPKHLAMPICWDNYFGFVCTPRHRTYQNIKREGCFSVSYPSPSQIVLTSLAAAPRCEDNTKMSMKGIPTFPSKKIDSVFIKDGYLYFECELDKIIDGFGANSLIAGQIIAAYINENFMRSLEKDDQELIHNNPLLAYLHPGRFAKIDNSFSYPLPIDFKR